MNIAIEVQRIQRSEKHGIEVFGLELIRELQKLDTSEHHFFIFYQQDSGADFKYESKNFHFIPFNSSSFAYWEQVLLPKKCKEHNIDLLHLTGNTAPLFLNTPYIQTVHDIIYMDKLDFGATYYQFFGNLYRRLNVPLTIHKSKIVTTVSNYEKSRIHKKFGIDPDKIIKIYNGVSPEYFEKVNETRKNAIREKYNLPQRFALFLGNTSPRKNASTIVKSFLEYSVKSKSDLKLVTPSLSLEKLSSLTGIEKDKLNSFAHHTGYFDKEDLPTIYQLSEMLLFVSLSEGFGLPIIEGFASGCPVITSTYSAMPEIAGDAALLVDPYKISEIKNAIAQLDQNEDLRTELSEKGKERAKQFSWKNTASEYLKLYQLVGTSINR